MSPAVLKPAVFLDRDDTLLPTQQVTAHLSRPGDLLDPSLVSLLPGVGAALRRLADAGYALVLFSNQGGLARGPLPEPPGTTGVGPATLEQVERVNDAMRRLLRAEAVRLAAAYWCPFHPKGSVPRFAAEHPWRKPAPGMLLTAAAELRLDLTRSWAIGDAKRDIEAAIAAGIAPARALQVATGKEPADHADLIAAVNVILKSA